MIGSSKSKILEKLLTENLSAVELADRMEICVSTVRGHLHSLEEAGVVDYYFDKTDKGRPKKKYKITSESKETCFPRKYRLLLSEMISEIKKDFGDKKIRSLIDKLSYNLAECLRGKIEGGDIEERIEKLEECLDEWGFYPSLEKKGRVYLLRYENCIFYELAKEFPEIVSEIDRKLICFLLSDCEVEEVECVCKGDNSCIKRIIPKKSNI